MLRSLRPTVTYRQLGRFAFCPLPCRGVVPGDKQPSEPILERLGVLLDPELHYLGPVPHSTQVRVHPDRLPERCQERRRHPREPGIEGEQLEPLPERPSAAVLQSLDDPCTAAYLRLYHASPAPTRR